MPAGTHSEVRRIYNETRPLGSKMSRGPGASIPRFRRSQSVPSFSRAVQSCGDAVDESYVTVRTSSQGSKTFPFAFQTIPTGFQNYVVKFQIVDPVFQIRLPRFKIGPLRFQILSGAFKIEPVGVRINALRFQIVASRVATILSACRSKL